MVWHARLLGMWIYISNRRMKPRQRRDCNHTKRERRDEWKVWKLPIYERSGWKCEICGADIHRGGQIHHVLPYGRFPELARDERNMMCLCNDCHREVHNNPYYNIRLQEEKALEYNINLKELYNYGKKLDERENPL